MKTKSTVQWFVECNPFSNESLQRALAEHAINDAESKHIGVFGSDGKPHDVTRIPASFVKKLLTAKQGDKRFNFRFFKRNGTRGVIYPADFLEKPRMDKKLREAREQLTEILATKKK